MVKLINFLKIKRFSIPILIFVLLIILFIIGSWLYYSSIHEKWLENRDSQIKQLLNYYNILNSKVKSSLTTYVQRKSTETKKQLVKISDYAIIYDIKGREIGKISEQQKTPVPLQNVSSHFINTLILIEDKNFRDHEGVDYTATLRAMMQNIIHFKIRQGGSTITQQLAKVLFFPEQEKSLERKIYEMFIAQEIERLFSKEQILFMYVNYIYFGHNLFGIENACRYYFNKRAKDLSLVDSALLVSLISNPGLYSPFNHPQKAKRHHLLILKTMSKEKSSTDSFDYEETHKRFWQKYNYKQIMARHQQEGVVKNSYVLEEVKQQAIETIKLTYHHDSKMIQDFLHNNGWKIYTTIDLDIQKAAEESLRQGIVSYRKSQQPYFSLKHELKQIQGAIIALNPKNGHIKAFVGGDQFEQENQLNRVFQAKRQTGSAFKPICYLAALEKRLITPYSLRFDRYKPIILKDGSIWKVRNYGNRYYNRFITITEAVKVSSNQIAAQIVTEMGVAKVRDILKLSLDLDDAEAKTRFPDEIYSIALGTISMTPLELARVYAMIANQGIRVKPKLLLKITNKNDKRIIFEAANHDGMPKKGLRVAAKESAYQIIEMMRGVLSPGGTGWLTKQEMNLDMDVAGKTGTSQKYRDLWFTGLTPELCTVVWIGHDNNHPLKEGGGKVAGPIFAKFIKRVSSFIPFSRFQVDSSYQFKPRQICRDSGQLAVKNNCSNIEARALFIPGTEAKTYCPVKHNQNEDEVQEFIRHTFEKVKLRSAK